uniref:Mitochondrial import receptor subunit TOM22 homolog n=1 Tax=Onchocerca volvulus TaxID=6282 RepID=A0A8R1XWW0_ONCVO
MAVSKIGGDEWDQIPDDELEETIAERLWGLREMFPDVFRCKLESSVDWSVWAAKHTFSFMKSALWIVSSSMMILVLPYVIEKERSEYEKSQVAQQRQMLLGPSAAVEKRNISAGDSVSDLVTFNEKTDFASKETNTTERNLALQNSLSTRKKKQKVEVNRFRPIIYSEGELDKSDFMQQPSRNNPLPFDPSTNPLLLPPTHSWSIANYVNHLPVLQVLVELGMDLFEVDLTTDIGRKLVKLDWENDVRPKLIWLIHQVGMPIIDVGSYLTRNPYFLLQDLGSMQVRLNYLYSKQLNKAKILKIVRNNRFWLNTDVKIIDARLGWIQKTFELTGDEMRQVIVTEPRVIIYGIGPLERLVIMLNEELEFTKEQIKAILLEDPRVFMIESSALHATYNYLRFTMHLSNMQIAEWPLCLRFSIGAIRRRHEFLVQLQKADYNEGSPNYVHLSSLLQPSDQKFAVNVAHTYLTVYNTFLKNY